MHGAATKGVTLNTEWELLTIKCAIHLKELLTIINQIEHIYSTLKKKKIVTAKWIFIILRNFQYKRYVFTSYMRN